MPRREGFTLIELLLATVLMSVLMLGVLAVITRVSSPIELPTEGGLPPEQEAVDACIRVLRADLSQARTLDVQQDALRMMGYASLDPQTHERSQSPVRIRYEVTQINGRPWLLRHEQPLVDADHVARRTDPVLAGVTRIALTAEPEAADSAKQSRSRRGADEQAGASPEPLIESRWTLELWLDETRGPAIRQSVLLHRRLSQ